MKHSNVQISMSSYGIFDVVLSLLSVMVFFFVPVFSVVVNGKVFEHKTIISMMASSTTSYEIIPAIFFFAIIFVIGFLKISLHKVFHLFVLSVIHLYFMFSFFISFIFITYGLIDQIQTTTFWGNEFSRTLGFCFPILIFIYLAGFVYSILQYCSFYRWYPLQTLFWALHPIVCPLVSFILAFVFVYLFSAFDDNLITTITVVVSWAVFAVELWLLYTYGKKWNAALRAGWMRRHPDVLMKEESLPVTLSADVKNMDELVKEPIVEEFFEEEINKNDKYVENNSSVDTHSVAIQRQCNKRNFLPYIWGGIGVVVVVFVLLFMLRGKEDAIIEVKPDVPAVRETLYEGKVANANVQMLLAEYGDSLAGSYFYTRIKRPIQLKGKKKNASDCFIDEFVDGNHVGSFELMMGNYDGLSFMNGNWSNEKKTVKVYLEELIHRILPSSDPNHPFVGEWITTDKNSDMAYVKLGLYNKDIDGDYAFITMIANGKYTVVNVDSVLELNMNDALLQVNYGTEESQKFKLHFSPSDKSLLVETEYWGTYHLKQDTRDLITRLEDHRKSLESVPELPDIKADDVLESLQEQDTENNESYNDINLPEIEQATITVQEKVAEPSDMQSGNDIEPQNEIEDKNAVYNVVEEMPEYPGGMSAMMRFIVKNLKYPEEAQRDGIKGRVLINFVVDVDGALTEIKVFQSVNPYLDKEAIRVVSSMPKWKPGRQKGKPVKVKYTIPINFSLQ